MILRRPQARRSSSRRTGALTLLAFALLLMPFVIGCAGDDFLRVHGSYPTPHGSFGLNERVFYADAIARAKLKDTRAYAEFIGTRGDCTGIYDKARYRILSVLRFVNERDDCTEMHQGLVEFTFDVFEYLKGGGGDELVAVATVNIRSDVIQSVMDRRARGEFIAWYDINYDNPYTSMELALEAARKWENDRDGRWDDREAIIMVYERPIPDSTNEATRYTLGDIYGYGIDTSNRVWLPSVEPVSAGTSSSETRFLLEDTAWFETISASEMMNFAPQTGRARRNTQSGRARGKTQPETISASEMKAVVAKLEKWIMNGEGVDGHLECIRESFRDESYLNGIMERGESAYLRYNHSLASGLPAQTVAVEISRVRGDKAWIAGEDAELFELPPNYNSMVLSKRPLPAGEYAFYENFQAIRLIPCDYLSFRTRNTIEHFVHVTPPDGVVHEAFFDPAASDDKVGFSDTFGKLSPAAFTVGQTETTIESLHWQSGEVALTLAPPASLSGYALDFIALDGAVSATLGADDATVEGGTLTWADPAQPWSDGDLLMLRIHETAPEP